MKRNKRFTALALAAVVGMGSMTMPTTTVKAEENEQEYIVYTEEVSDVTLGEYTDTAETIYTEAEAELLENADMAVAELTEQEAEELEEVSEEVIVEENIWLEGAGRKKSKKTKNKKAGRKENTQKQDMEANFVEEPDTEDAEGEAAVEAIYEMAESEWNRKAVGAEIIPADEKGSIKVAVIDSGVDITEDIDIAERVDLTSDEAASYLCQDMTGHGTGVASVIGAKDNEIGTTGINGALEIYSVKIMDENNRAPLSRVLAALQWCQENDMDVVNMSFGTTAYSEIFEKAIKEAEASGMLLVASAGNGETVEYPAAFAEVIGVGSITADMQMDEDCASGEGVELAAPGKYVPVTAQLGSATIASGSSYAAPHVTAVAATLWNKVPEWNNRKIRTLLAAGAKELEGTEESCYGLVDYAYTESIMEEFSVKYDNAMTDIVSEEAKETEVSGQPENIEEPEDMAQELAVVENEVAEAYENTTQAESYTIPEYVEANWSATNHAALATNAVSGGSAAWQTCYTTKKIEIFKEVSVLVDTNATLKSVKALHAATYEDPATGKRTATNYVSVTRYLYEIAKAQKKSPKKSIATIISEKGTPAYLTEPEEAAIKKAVKTVCASEAIPTVKFDSNQAGKNRGLRVLGMALHVSGDAFAHKAMVPNDSTTERIIRNDLRVELIFESQIKTKFQSGTLTTAGLSKICKNNGIEGANGLFEDKIGFLPKRYTLGAQKATKCLLRDYYKNDKFDINMFSHEKNDIKQYKLAEFVNEAKTGL